MSTARIRGILAWAALVAGCAACSDRAVAPAPATAPTDAGPVLTYQARLGREVWQHYCQLCHGESGAGDGFNAFNLDPRPRDLSDPAFQKKKSDAELADAIHRGGAGVGLSALMPPWGRTLSDREIREVIAHVRTLRRTP